MRVSICRPSELPVRRFSTTNFLRSRVNEDSILAVQVFDQKKFKKKDQGFLGVINIRIGDIIELAPDADGSPLFSPSPMPNPQPLPLTMMDC